MLLTSKSFLEFLLNFELDAFYKIVDLFMEFDVFLTVHHSIDFSK